MSVVSEEVLGRVLAQHGVGLDAREFLTILDETLDTTDTLTESERDFAVAHSGLPAEAFAPDGQRSARRRIAIAAAQADAASSRGYTTSQVAKMLGIAPANVRRLIARRDLYPVGRSNNREHVFPAWQFTGGRTTPHLREVLDALPDDMHPLDVEGFMTTPQETLGDRSPMQWLSQEGPAGPVVELADELARG